jgi:hypothetical protein
VNRGGPTEVGDIADELLDRSHAADRPAFDRAFARELTAWVRDCLLEISSSLPAGVRLRLNKRRLTEVHGCEGHAVAARDAEFVASVPTTRGALAHKAIEFVIVSGYRHSPLIAVDLAAQFFREEGSEFGPAPFLYACSEAQRLELTRDACDAVTKFVGDWPRIPASWDPRVDSASVVDFGKVRVTARPDLVLGVPSDTRARVFAVDLKTGVAYDFHRADVHFYALVETMRTRRPPWRVATYYLDQGTYTYDDVDNGLLEAAARRLIDGARLLAELSGGRPARLSPGRSCRICPAASTCATGEPFLTSERGVSAW